VGDQARERRVQRLEFEDIVERGAYVSFLDDVLARVSAFTAIAAANAPANLGLSRGNGPTAIRFGAVGVRGSADQKTPEANTPVDQASLLDLNAEVDAIRWVHEEVDQKEEIPLLEAESIVRSLSVAMHGDSQMLLPLLTLKEFDQYTTTHALNVSVLSMGLAEFMGLSPREVRAFGVAGMLHDLGKVRVPKDILTKPGKLTPEEWSLMRSHTVEGARLILQSDQNLDVAALVAFEHHIMINGGGYPDRHYRCDCHKASALVHVCDVYDALRKAALSRCVSRRHAGIHRARHGTVRRGSRKHYRDDGEVGAAIGLRESLTCRGVTAPERDAVTSGRAAASTIPKRPPDRPESRGGHSSRTRPARS
jgi:putative nucleotidyltransferase with HDIG domain